VGHGGGFKKIEKNHLLRKLNMDFLKLSLTVQEMVLKTALSCPEFEPQSDNNYSICYASENGHTEIVKLLLADPRVNPSDQDNCAIQCASGSGSGHTEIVKLLENHKKPVLTENKDSKFLIDGDTEELIVKQVIEKLQPVNRHIYKVRPFE
jgi:hypothetical protein